MTSEPVYLDASSVLRWAFHIGGSPSPRDEVGYRCLESLIGGTGALALSTVTLIEVTSNTNSKLRATDDWYASFGDEQAEAVQVRLMELIRTGRIEARNLGPRAFEVAIMYVNQATAIARAKLLAWDAVHLAEAVRWSIERDEQVLIATSDGDFPRFLTVLPELGTRVRVLDVTTENA
jgi:hypothetical protein